MIRPYINDNLNSRIDHNLPEGIWRIKWKSQLLNGLSPEFILQSGDRIIVQGSQVWQLFDIDGKPIAANNFANSDVAIDPTNSLIYTADYNSMFEAYQLANGELAYILDDLYGVKFQRTFVTRVDNTFIAVSNEQIMDPHSSEKPELSYLETQIIGKQVQVDNLKILSNAVRGKLEKRISAETIAASNNGILVIAYKNHVEYLDLSLNVVSSFEDNFIPMAMSLDENSNAYLIVKTDEDKYALWIINLKGQKIFEYPVKQKEKYYPPCIGFDDKIYLNFDTNILAINLDKGLLWDQPCGMLWGITAIANNRLLVSEDKYIFAFDEKGERKFVYDFESEKLATATVIGETGEIFVSSRQFLYCLTTKK